MFISDYKCATKIELKRLLEDSKLMIKENGPTLSSSYIGGVFLFVSTIKCLLGVILTLMQAVLEGPCVAVLGWFGVIYNLKGIKV